MKIVVCALASVFAFGGVSASEAETGTMVVKVRGVDTGSVSGAAVVLRRINGAARTFCGGDYSRQLSYYSEQVRCRRHMAYLAVNKLDKPMVTALYEETSRPPILFAERGIRLASR